MKKTAEISQVFYPLRRVDNSRVVSELEHPEDGGEDGVDEESRQTLKKKQHLT